MNGNDGTGLVVFACPVRMKWRHGANSACNLPSSELFTGQARVARADRPAEGAA
jgi:hypothetical protein